MIIKWKDKPGAKALLEFNRGITNTQAYHDVTIDLMPANNSEIDNATQILFDTHFKIQTDSVRMRKNWSEVERVSVNDTNEYLENGYTKEGRPIY
jgi:hypothetical protein